MSLLLTSWRESSPNYSVPEIVIRLHSERMTFSDIARELGVSRRRVDHVARKYGLRPWKRWPLNYLSDLLDTACTPEQVDALNCLISTFTYDKPTESLPTQNETEAPIT